MTRPIYGLFLLLTLCLSAAFAEAEAPPVVDPGPIVVDLGGIELLPPPVEYAPPVLVNPGARVPIWSYESPEAITADAELPFQILGLYFYDDNGREAIWIVGPYTDAAGILLHEFVHHLEAKLPDQAQRIRDALHDITSEQFDIDHMDLMGSIVMPEGK